MNKYSLVQKVISRLTDDDTFRTFYTLYLSAENDEKRNALGQQFWKDIEVLPTQEQRDLRAEFTRCFLRLPKLLEELDVRADIEKVA